MSKQPLRTCLGCNEVHSKRQLLRIVKTSDGKIKVDLSGKLSGRGAYLCLKEDCIKKALRGNTIAKALKVEPKNVDKEALSKAALSIMIQESRSKNDQKKRTKARE